MNGANPRIRGRYSSVVDHAQLRTRLRVLDDHHERSVTVAPQHRQLSKPVAVDVGAHGDVLLRRVPVEEDAARTRNRVSQAVADLRLLVVAIDAETFSEDGDLIRTIA